jgi:hypothetical protein
MLCTAVLATERYGDTETLAFEIEHKHEYIIYVQIYIYIYIYTGSIYHPSAYVFDDVSHSFLQPGKAHSRIHVVFYLRVSDPPFATCDGADVDTGTWRFWLLVSWMSMSEHSWTQRCCFPRTRHIRFHGCVCVCVRALCVMTRAASAPKS